MPSTDVHEELLCAGFGGQGIMFLGKLLAQAAMVQGLNVTYLPSYGAEVRGGTAHCNIILSSDEIASPLVGRPTSVIVMNHPSLLKFEERVRPGGLLIVNSSLALSSPSRQDIHILEVPATEMADSLGTVQVANMVVLGGYLQQRPVVAFSIVMESLAEVLPKRRHDLLHVNQAALRQGAELVARQGKAAPATGPG